MHRPGRSGRLRVRPRSWVALLALTTLTLGACAENTLQTDIEQATDKPQNFLEPIGRWALELDELWNLVFWIAVAIFVLVQGLIIVAILRFRERPGDTGTLPKQIHGNPRLEAIWTIIPALILAVVAVPTVGTLFDLYDVPEDSLHIQVIGHQWWWEYQYPDYEGLETANILHIPTGRSVVLEVTSADVIHSFWVPKLAGKQDTVPGRTNIIQLHTDEPGEYLGQCAEFCGLSHANMRLRVIAHPPGEFEAWASQEATPVEGEPDEALAAEGRQQFIDSGCTACHSIRGFEEAAGQTGPDLTYFSDRDWFAGAIFENTDENLEAWLRDPPAMKPMEPGNNMGMPDLGLTEDEIDALVAYLRTLRSPE